MGCAVALLAGTFLYYANPPGRQTVTFEVRDAAAIKSGQDVRVAGVSVGKITGVDLGESTVRVAMELADDIHVGAESRVEVRMLTPVGGYAVTLVPLGSTPLPEDGIPPERVSVPYSIGDVIQSIPEVTDHLEGDAIDANIEQVAAALEANPESVGSIIEGFKSMAGVMDRQRDQVHRIADLAAEYVTTFESNQDMVFEMIRKIDIVLSTYNVNHVGFNRAYELLGRVLATLQPYEAAFLENKDILYENIVKVRTMIEEYNQTMGPAIDGLVSVKNQLEGWLTPNGFADIAGGELTASTLCLPLPGQVC